MRLPFSSRKGQDQSDSSRRSSIHENRDGADLSPSLKKDGESEKSGSSPSMPMDTPATSFSSHSSGEKAGMYKLSGNVHMISRD